MSISMRDDRRRHFLGQQQNATMTSKTDKIAEEEEIVALKDEALLSKSAKGAKLLIILQIASRALTFTVNQFLLRYLSPSMLGISTQLEVFSMSILFFAREAIRVAIQRQTDESDVPILDTQNRREEVAKRKRVAATKTQTVVNLAYISIVLGFLFTVSLQWLYLRSVRTQSSFLSTPYFVHGLYIYSGAALLELLFEPSFLVVQQKSKYETRVAADMVATFSRCLVTCGTVVYASRKGIDLGVLPFALGQLAFAVSMLSVYVSSILVVATQSGFSLLPKTITASPPYSLGYFNPSIVSLASSLFIQGLLKHVLTQGDILLVSTLSTLTDQGIYALASNYGGLVARLLFQPIEESSRNYFAKALASVDQVPDVADSQVDKTTSSTIDTTTTSPAATQLATASSHFHKLLHMYSLISLTAVTLGPTLAPLLLTTVAGKSWSSTAAPAVLGKYTYYIPLIALNGITESFVSSIASKSDLNSQSLYMVSFSMIFAISGYTFLRVFGMGAEGLVWANCVNMSCRIVWSTLFIRGWLKKRGETLKFREIVPERGSVTAAVVAAAVLTRVSAELQGGLWSFIRCAPAVGGFLAIL